MVVAEDIADAGDIDEAAEGPGGHRRMADRDAAGGGTQSGSSGQRVDAETWC